VAAKKTEKVRKNFKLPADLAAWIESYARDCNTSMTQLIVDHFTKLREKQAHVEQI
jgi:hypothetical protein